MEFIVQNPNYYNMITALWVWTTKVILPIHDFFNDSGL